MARSSYEYPWQKYPEAILGLIYLYWRYGEDIPQSEIAAFVDRHQDPPKNLDSDKVEVALHRSQYLIADSQGQKGGSEIHRDMWLALMSLRGKWPALEKLFASYETAEHRGHRGR